MKMIVITERDGKVAGFTRSVTELGFPQLGRAGLQPGPGQKMHEIEVPDELAAIDNGEELHRRLQAHLPKK